MNWATIDTKVYRKFQLYVIYKLASYIMCTFVFLFAFFSFFAMALSYYFLIMSLNVSFDILVI